MIKDFNFTVMWVYWWAVIGDYSQKKIGIPNIFFLIAVWIQEGYKLVGP